MGSFHFISEFDRAIALASQPQVRPIPLPSAPILAQPPLVPAFADTPAQAFTAADAPVEPIDESGSMSIIQLW
jgi:hypothetical protein